MQYDTSDVDDCPNEPPGFACRTPVSTISIFDDRVEITDSWCYESGHAMQYVDFPVKTFRRDDPELMKIVERKFQPDVVAEVRSALEKRY